MKLKLKDNFKPENDDRLKVLSLCSGVGGFELGLDHKKFNVVGFSEIDKHCNMVLKYHWPRIKNYGDITKLKADDLPNHNLCVSGTPCQDLSIAGQRTGINGKRSGLFYKFVEVLKTKKPEYFIWENVGGSLNSNRGCDFAIIQSELDAAGYDFEWFILNAKDFGVPQSRERVFIVGYLRGSSGREILLERRKDRENGEHGAREKEPYQSVHEVRKERKNFLVAYSKSTRENHIDHRANIHTVANTLSTGEGGRSQSTMNYVVDELQGQRVTNYGSAARIKTKDEIADTVQAGDNGGCTNLRPHVIDKHRIRRLTPLEGERLMSWPDGHTRFGINDNGLIEEISDTKRYKMIGNGVVSNKIKFIMEHVLEL